ncbi:MAG: dihydrodipicolinate synthase family protein [Chloroflexota bacterium]|nr:dihydrodipicolinate synthase family protein [Chloroflexota bacterium]
MFGGVLVATSVPFRVDLSLDLDLYAAHCRWLVDNGADGLIPNGSLGEYQALTDDERAAVVRTAVDAARGRAKVVPGVGAASGHASRRWAEQAARAGADGVMALPPTGYRVSVDEALAHFREVAAAGLPVMIYNNPFDTRIDLTPEILARLQEIDGVVAVKEFSGDVRRVAEIQDAAPGLQVLCGSDDVALESFLMGATGWVAGFSNAFPSETAWLFQLAMDGEFAAALPVYRSMLPALRWDARPKFVQAIKLAQELVGRYGGPCRLPRLPLTDEEAAAVRAAVERVAGLPG